MLPEYAVSTDMIQILDNDVEIFAPDNRAISHYYSIEKSMYRAISDAMLQLFASVDELNNLIGDPVNHYRLEYKSMSKLRELFFRRVGNTPDLEKYLKYYKWIDKSIGEMLQQLFPASSKHSTGVRTMVESHILERSKYPYTYMGQ